MLSADKFARLTRTKELDESDFNDFINRQLVVTNQTAKAVAELLQRKYGQFGTKVVYSKAKNVSEFRAEYDIFKCRETNDLHHARDAYLNVVVGNVYDTKYSHVYFSGSNSWAKYSLKNLFKHTANGAWEGDSTLAHVKNVVAKTSMMVTHYTTTGKGEFYDQTIYSKEDKGISVPRKLSAPYCDMKKYGGYKSLSTAYFAIVSSKDIKGNEMRTIEAIPVLVDYQSRYDENAVIKYLLASGLIEPQIIVPKIKIKTLLSVNGYKVRIAGITGSQILLHNAQQWKTDAKTDRYVKQLDKLVQMEKDGKLQDKDLEKESFDMIKNKDGEITLTINREENLNVYKQVQDVLALPCYQGLSSVKSFAATLAEAKEKFQTISVLQQAKVLLQLARFMRCNAETADLKLVGKGAACGKILINKKLAGVDVSIIHQSACGLQKKVATL